MAMNKEYYDLAYAYVMDKGMGAVEADNIATTLAVLIPTRHDIGKEDGHVWPDNAHVVECVKKLHQGESYLRIIPLGLNIPVISVDSVNELPVATTYGQRYHVCDTNLIMETKLNGVIESIGPRLTLQVSEPLGIDPDDLAKLREKATQCGFTVEVWNKDVDHPDNVIGLAKMKQMLAEANSQLQPEPQTERDVEVKGGWSKPAGKINFRTRHLSNITRMRNNRRRG
jgi:hypothetical protein